MKLVTFPLRIPLYCLGVITLLCVTAQWAVAQNPYMLSEPFSRRAELWDHRHNTPFNFNLAYNRAKEAGRNLNYLLRNELYAGVILTSGRLQYRFVQNEDIIDKHDAADTGFTIDVRPKSSFQFGESSSHPIATLSDNAALLIAHGVSVHFIDWSQPDFNVLGKDRAYEITTACLGIPLGIDFKSGAEAMLDRSKRDCFTAGIGIQPTVVYSSVGYRGSNTTFRLCPTAKVEYGIATPFAVFKLRATGYFTKFNYLDVGGIPEEFRNQHSEIALKGGSQFSVCLVIMPLASKWEDGAWYR